MRNSFYYSGLFRDEIIHKTYTQSQITGGHWVDALGATASIIGRFVPNSNSEDKQTYSRDTGYVAGTLYVPQRYKGATVSINVDDRFTIDSTEYRANGPAMKIGGNGGVYQIPLGLEENS